MNNQDNNERRIEHRVQEKATIFLELLSESEKDTEASVIICNSVDLSANGIQVQVDEAVAIGSILRLVVDFSNHSDPIYLIGEVKWVSESQGQHFIGFELYDAENSNIIGWKNRIAEMLG
jgi:Tfp pilus assembly protein PilZ